MKNHESQAEESRYEPTYNLKAVVKETGLKADTLRAWERRYGLPSPERTPSGHRLYSKRDIGILKWLLARQQEGLSISRAVVLWQRLEEEGVDPIDPNEPNNLPLGNLNPESSSIGTDNIGLSKLSQTGHIQELRKQWISACLVFDESQAEQVLASAFSLFDTETVCLELLFKGISEIGVGWSEGRVTAQQEHFASALATRRLHSLHNGTPAPTRPGKILMGCPPDEEHVFSSILLSLLLRRRGWNILFLGANIPLENLSDTVTTVQPDLVILIAQQLHTAGTLLEMGEALVQTNTPLAFGGAVFVRSPDLQQCISGHYLGDQIENAVSIVEQVMASPRIRRAMQAVPLEHIETLKHFRTHRGDIENQVWHDLMAQGAERRIIDSANRCIAQNVIAALSLCKVGVMESELDGVVMLLVSHYNLPSELADDYIEYYYRAARKYLGDDGRVLVNWLEKLTGERDSVYS